MSLTSRAGIIADTDCVGLWETDVLTGFVNNDPVGSFPDASGWVAPVGTTKPMQQGTGANKPLYLTNQRNGLPALSFDGSNDFLESTPRQATAATMVLVRKLSSAGTGANKVQMQMSGPVATGLGLYQSNAGPPGKHSAYLRGNVGINSTTNTTTNWEIVVLACGNSGGSAGNTLMYVNGTQIISTTDDMVNITSDLGAFFIGKDDSGTLMSGAMLVGAAAVFKRKLSPGDVADITNYFNGIWGDLPGTPTSLDVDEGGTNLELSWSAPVGGGSVTSYQVRIDGGSASTATSPHDFTGLTPGTTHTLEVRAVGPGGNGAWASIVADTLELPGDPTNVDATPDYTTITLTWDPPTTGGDVDSYEVRIDGGTETAGTSPHDFTGLTPATSYSVEVRAVGPAGAGDWVEVIVETLDDTVTARYHIDLRVGAHTWAIDYTSGTLDGLAAPLPLAGAMFSWAAPDDVGWPPRPWLMEADTCTVRVIAPDADSVADVKRGDVLRFAFTPEGYGATSPLVDFAGLITSTPKITRHELGVVLEVSAVDYRLVLSMVTIFGRNDFNDGGQGVWNTEDDLGEWYVSAETGIPPALVFDARRLVNGDDTGDVEAPDGSGTIVNGGWKGTQEWINEAIEEHDYGLPWLTTGWDMFAGQDIDTMSSEYAAPAVAYTFGSTTATIDDAYRALGVYPWPVFDEDGNLTGYKFHDVPLDGTGDYTLSELDAGIVLGDVEWRRGVHPERVDVKVDLTNEAPFETNLTGQETETYGPGEPTVEAPVKRITYADSRFGSFALEGFRNEVITAAWAPYRMDVLADLDPEVVRGWFNYPDRVAVVVRIFDIETIRHPADLSVAPEGEFYGRLCRASLTIGANGRWSVQARVRPRLPRTIIDDLTP